MGKPLPLVIFIFSVLGMLVCLIKDITLRVPKYISSNRKLKIDSICAPLLGVFVLLTSGTLTFHALWKSGTIEDALRIIVLFNALAYVCVSIDATGCLAFISFKVASAAGNSRKKLFIYFYLLSSIMTTVTSNDIVIMTLTPIVLQCAQLTKSSPWPFLFAQFFAANTCSFVIVIGNPTNIIIADALGIGFAEFSKIMIIPAITTTMLGGVLLYSFMFKSELQGTFDPPTLKSDEYLLDKRGAYVHGGILGLCVILMAVSSWATDQIKLWMVSAVFAGISLGYNLWSYSWSSAEAEMKGKALEMLEILTQKQLNGSEEEEEAELTQKAVHSSASQFIDPINASDAIELGDADDLKLQAPADDPLSSRVEDPESSSLTSIEACREVAMRPVFPTIKAGIWALPWRLIPFVFSMFVLVQALQSGGWIDEMSRGFLYIMGGESATSSSSGGSQFIPALILMLMTCLFCNLINNQPATLLIARILVSSPMAQMSKKAKLGAAFSAIAGSNLAASLTIVGALAGIMFVQLLKLHGKPISYVQFAKVGFKFVPMVAVYCAVITAVCCYWV